LTWVKLKKHSRGALEDTIDCVMLGYFGVAGNVLGWGPVRYW
jgi:hypothetical protein